MSEHGEEGGVRVCASVCLRVCFCVRVCVCACMCVCFVCVLWLGGAWVARAFSRCRAIRGWCGAAARGTRCRPDPVPARRPRRRACRHRPDPRAAEARLPPPAGRGAVECASRWALQPGTCGCRLSTGGARRPLSISHDGTTADDLLLMDILWSDPTDRPQTALPSRALRGSTAAAAVHALTVRGVTMSGVGRRGWRLG